MTKRTINLALQGGGAQGAYTWGVLDRILDEDDIEIEGISGTSAGAMNAAFLVSGHAKGGRAGAKAALENLWRSISEISAFSPLRQTPFSNLLNKWNLDQSPAYVFFDGISRLFSPYDTNPLNLNPLKTVLEKNLDIDALNNKDCMKIFITATSTTTGQAKIFGVGEMSIDVLLASSCLPLISRGVEINGDTYWDGGYSGNPALWPLIYHCKSRDVILVQINPFERKESYKKASEIIDRMNEITFNAGLIAELRAIRFVSKLVAENKLDKSEYKDLRMHLIYSPKELAELNASSKMNAEWEFFLYLKEIGRNAADNWIKNNGKSLGKEATLVYEDIFKAEAPAQPPSMRKKKA